MARKNYELADLNSEHEDEFVNECIQFLKSCQWYDEFVARQCAIYYVAHNKRVYCANENESLVPNLYRINNKNEFNKFYRLLEDCRSKVPSAKEMEKLRLCKEAILATDFKVSESIKNISDNELNSLIDFVNTKIEESILSGNGYLAEQYKDYPIFIIPKCIAAKISVSDDSPCSVSLTATMDNGTKLNASFSTAEFYDRGIEPTTELILNLLCYEEIIKELISNCVLSINDEAKAGIEFECKKIIESPEYISISPSKKTGINAIYVYRREGSNLMPSPIKAEVKDGWIRVNKHSNFQFSIDASGQLSRSVNMVKNGSLTFYPQNEEELKQFSNILRDCINKQFANSEFQFSGSKEIEIRCRKSSPSISVKLSSAKKGFPAVHISELQKQQFSSFKDFYEYVAECICIYLKSLSIEDCFESGIDLAPYLPKNINQAKYLLLQHIFCFAYCESKTEILNSLPKDLTERYKTAYLKEILPEVLNTYITIPEFSSYDLIYNGERSNKYGEYDVYGIDNLFKECFLSDENIPKLSKEDFPNLKTEYQKQLLFNMMQNAKTSDDKWEVIDCFASLPATIQKAVATAEIGLSFFRNIDSEDDKNYAVLLLSQIPGCKKLASQILN